MVDGSAIAAIVTGILALLGAVGTAWMSGWNEQRVQSRADRKALTRYSVDLLIAAWDLANWFYDILEENNYHPERCAAYGDGWNSIFTSYRLGQYFARVHIIREMTHYFVHIRDEQADMLNKLLWKIQDEFVSMHYEAPEDWNLRWFEGDILAMQELLTTPAGLDRDGGPEDMLLVGWADFQQRYEAVSGDNKPSQLKRILERYEYAFQRIIYRRFKHLYSTKWTQVDNPQSIETLQNLQYDNEELIKELLKEEGRIQEEQRREPHAGIMIPDHRIRRLQHLLVDLVLLLDEVSAMHFNRPVRKCEMLAPHNKFAGENPSDGVVTKARIPCDCASPDCNPTQSDFAHRSLAIKRGWKALNTPQPTYQSPAQLNHQNLRRKTTEKHGGIQC